MFGHKLKSVLSQVSGKMPQTNPEGFEKFYLQGLSTQGDISEQFYTEMLKSALETGEVVNYLDLGNRELSDQVCRWQKLGGLTNTWETRLRI